MCGVSVRFLALSCFRLILDATLALSCLAVLGAKMVSGLSEGGIRRTAPGAVAAGAGPSAAAPGADLPWLLLLARAGTEADVVATAAGDGFRAAGAMEPSPPFEPSRRDRLRAGAASGFAAGFLSIDLPRDTGAGSIRLVETTADGTSGAAAAAADPAIGAGVGVGPTTGIGTAGVTLGLRLPLCGAGIAGGSRPEEFHGALPRSLGSFRTGPKAPALGPLARRCRCAPPRTLESSEEEGEAAARTPGRLALASAPA